MRIIALILLAVLLGMAGWFVYGAHEVATGQMGMASLTLPSGTTVWMRRQSYADTPEHLYLSTDPDYCAPYDRWHDVELPRTVTGATDHPLLLSFSGDVIVIHSADQTTQRWFNHPKIAVKFERLTDAQAVSFVAQNSALPKGWQRIEVPWGHNTCSL